ncbi:MAG TPA: hypothetical protein VIV11_38315 [Kofleriaceae bacterium]
MQFEAIAVEEIEEVAGGVDWNQVGMQAMTGAAALGTAGWAATGGVPIGGIIGAGAGALIGGGLGVWSTWDQTTRKPAAK